LMVCSVPGFERVANTGIDIDHVFPDVMSLDNATLSGLLILLEHYEYTMYE
jgi:hypothetical protein